MNECLTEHDIPKEWKFANIYPIPKPKDWDGDLNNTRPITLLETIRKILVKILNNRFAKIFVKNKVLKGNQFAGLPGQSTFEPIRILNEIIDDANEKDDNLIILFQDLSKAYDRVNLYMLDRAMIRLKIPYNFRKFIMNIFTNRKNRVFTAVGQTDHYEVLTGIDQGEVISPLLWCIYYDTLLVEIQKINIGYNLSHTFKTNVYNDTFNRIEKNIPIMAYMDDTSYITSNMENLEKMLTKADSFYDLNNIIVNKEKSEILIRHNKYEKEKEKSISTEHIDSIK